MYAYTYTHSHARARVYFPHSSHQGHRTLMTLTLEESVSGVILFNINIFFFQLQSCVSSFFKGNKGCLTVFRVERRRKKQLWKIIHNKTRDAFKAIPWNSVIQSRTYRGIAWSWLQAVPLCFFASVMYLCMFVRCVCCCCSGWLFVLSCVVHYTICRLRATTSLNVAFDMDIVWVLNVCSWCCLLPRLNVALDINIVWVLNVSSWCCLLPRLNVALDMNIVWVLNVSSRCCLLPRLIVAFDMNIVWVLNVSSWCCLLPRLNVALDMDIVWVLNVTSWCCLLPRLRGFSENVSPPAPFLGWNGNQLAHTSSTLYARISPRWFSELRRLWPNVPWQVACELVSGEVLTLCLDSGIVSPVRLRWVKDVCVLWCNLPPALLAEWTGCFMCHCGDTGVERTPNKSHYTELSLEKKILPPFLPGFELASFRSRD